MLFMKDNWFLCGLTTGIIIGACAAAKNNIIKEAAQMLDEKVATTVNETKEIIKKAKAGKQASAKTAKKAPKKSKHA